MSAVWLFISIFILERKERSVWRLAAPSLAPLLLPLTCLHIKDYHRGSKILSVYTVGDRAGEGETRRKGAQETLMKGQIHITNEGIYSFAFCEEKGRKAVLSRGLK